MLMAVSAAAQLRVSPDGRYLLDAGGRPFFWLGDTAWELFHRLNREEAVRYLEDRAAKGFTVIQCVALAELDGLNTPNPYGDLPLLGNDPAQPNEAYFKHVDFIIRKANRLGLTIALLPSWGDKWNTKWGVGPEVFTPENARIYGRWLGARYRTANLVWVLGGDRDCDEAADYEIIRAMAEGLRAGDGGAHLRTFHPQGGRSSFEFFPDDGWIDFHMSQTGHFNSAPNYQFNRKALARTPLKPHLDGEPRYEDHPNAFNPAEKGWMDDVEARQALYWNLLSGGCGHTYGNHSIWQMYQPGRAPISWARTSWQAALDHPGSTQAGIARRFFETLPWQQLREDSSLIADANPTGAAYRMAAVTEDRSLALVYIPQGQPTRVDLSLLRPSAVRAVWFNPRDGSRMEAGTFENLGVQEFRPQSPGRGSDWLLILSE